MARRERCDQVTMNLREGAACHNEAPVRDTRECLTARSISAASRKLIGLTSRRSDGSHRLNSTPLAESSRDRGVSHDARSGDIRCDFPKKF